MTRILEKRRNHSNSDALSFVYLVLPRQTGVVLTRVLKLGKSGLAIRFSRIYRIMANVEVCFA